MQDILLPIETPQSIILLIEIFAIIFHDYPTREIRENFIPRKLPPIR